MVASEILDKLSPVTPEEQQCRQNGTQVNWSVYNASAEHQVYAARFMEPGKLITVRPHTRFAYFPPHSHDYIEMIYMPRTPILCVGACIARPKPDSYTPKNLPLGEGGPRSGG